MRRHIDYKCVKITKGMPNDRCAAIEGMPLQLVIMVIVAGIVLSVIMGYIYLLGDTDPVIDRIIVNPDEVRASPTSVPVVTVTVLDTDGDPVKGAVVSIQGCGVDIVADLETGEEDIKLEGLTLPYGRTAGYLSVVAIKSGMGSKSTEVVVFQAL